MSDRKESGTVVMSAVSAQPTTGAPEGEACIILIHPPGPEIGRRTSLTRRSYLVGRDDDAELVIASEAVSRHHAILARDDDRVWSVRDLASTNGTFVNEQPTGEQRLRDGDQLRFGDTIFKFLTGHNIETAYHEEIYRMTILDGLTGVHNKRYLLEFIERELASARRYGSPLTLVMFDIDHFKAVNDERGHLCGDAVLKRVAQRVQARIRREDLFARYGGEEFVCVLTRTDLDGGIHFAESVRRIVERERIVFDGAELSVTISLGVTCLRGEPDVDSEEIIRRADVNLYEAKRAGRNQVVPAPPP